MRHEVLTGNTRHRLQRVRFGFGDWRDVIVLQVERKWLHTDCVGGMIDSEWIIDWRDATLEDLTVSVVAST